MPAITKSISQFHRAIRASRSDSRDVASARKIKNDKPLVSLRQVNNGVVLAESGSHVAYLGNRNELRDKGLLSSRLREFISDPKAYVKRVEFSYRQDLVCIGGIISADSKIYEDRARKEALKLGISEEQVAKDIADAFTQRRKNVVQQALAELELRFDPDAQRRLRDSRLYSI